MISETKDDRIHLENGDVEILADELEDTMGIVLDDDNCVDKNIITIDDLHNMMIKYFSAEHWYPLIENKGITMKSVLIPLSDEQVRKIIENENCPEFNAYIKEFTTDKVFVKLSSVSPKDVEVPYASTSEKIVSLLSNSPRTLSALKNNHWKQYLFLRECWDFIPDMPEFRVFVTSRLCVAISQNNLVGCKRNKNYMKKIIVEFTKSVINLLWYQDCTIDVCYDEITDAVFLIEINTPYYLVASTVLYNVESLTDEFILKGKFYDGYGTDIRFANSTI